MSLVTQQVVLGAVVGSAVAAGATYSLGAALLFLLAVALSAALAYGAGHATAAAVPIAVGKLRAVSWRSHSSSEANASPTPGRQEGTQSAGEALHRMRSLSCSAASPQPPQLYTLQRTTNSEDGGQVAGRHAQRQGGTLRSQSACLGTHDSARSGLSSPVKSEEAGLLQLVMMSRLPCSFAPWQLQQQDIEISTHSDGRPISLGQGSFGEVFLGTLKEVVPVAVKQMLVAGGSLAQRAAFKREVAMLMAIQSSNIVQVQGACLRGGRWLLVTELMEGGNLAKAIAKGGVSWRKRGASIAVDVARGLHFLHENGVVHLNLKSNNILLTRYSVAKLSDGGLAMIQDLQDPYLAGPLEPYSGSLEWAAPEVLALTACTTKTDIYSLGLVLHHIATGQAPGSDDMQQIRVPEQCPAEVADVIASCLRLDPAARPTAFEAYQTLHSAFKELEAQQLQEQRRLLHGSGRSASDPEPTLQQRVRETVVGRSRLERSSCAAQPGGSCSGAQSTPADGSEGVQSPSTQNSSMRLRQEAAVAAGTEGRGAAAANQVLLQEGSGRVSRLQSLQEARQGSGKDI